MKQYPFKSRWKRWITGCFDAVGGFFFYPVRANRKPMDLGTIKRILAVRLDHIGDVVMTRPALRALHKKFPHAAIDLLVSADTAPLFSNAKEIARVIPAPDGWFSRKASFGQKWAEFWRLVGILKTGAAYEPRHSEPHFGEESRFGILRHKPPQDDGGQDPSPSTGLRMTKANTGTYDLAIDFRGDLRNILLLFLARIRYRLGYGVTGGGFLLTEELPFDAAAHQVPAGLNLLKFFHVALDNKLLPFEYTQDQAREFWQGPGTGISATVLPRAMVHMGAGSPAKQWGDDNFRALLQKISEANLAQMILIGSQEEKDALPDLKLHVQNIIDLRGKVRLQDLPVLMDACDVFIGNDSGPAHIAAAQGLEIILLASGTNDIRFWHPWTERLSILQHDVPCSPCGARICPVEGHPCVEGITVDQVFDALRSVLSRLQKSN